MKVLAHKVGKLETNLNFVLGVKKGRGKVAYEQPHVATRFFVSEKPFAP